MVDPVSMTVGAVVAALVTRAAEKAGDNLADGATSSLGKLVVWLRGKFSGNPGDSMALKQLEEAPDSPARMKALAAAVDARASSDDDFRLQVQRLVAEAEQAGVPVQSITQTAWGDGNVQLGSIGSGSSVNIATGAVQRPKPGQA